jgi:hypothetical protein
MNMMYVLLTFGILLLCLGVTTVILCVSNAKLWIKLTAMEKSTHKFTIFNPDTSEEGVQEFKQVNQRLRQALETDMMGDLDNIA